MIEFRAPGFLLGLVLLVCLVQPAAAFGAGNIASISKVEGQNCTSPPEVLPTFRIANHNIYRATR